MFSKQRIFQSTSKEEVKRSSTQRQPRNSSKPDKCLICGDKATIINYGALSCQPCKTFFRRNGYRPQVRHSQHCSLPLQEFNFSYSVFLFVCLVESAISTKKHDATVLPVAMLDVSWKV